MSELGEFVRARLDERNDLARAAAEVTGDAWSAKTWGIPGREVAVICGQKETNPHAYGYQEKRQLWETEGVYGMPKAAAALIAAHDPAAVLRETVYLRAQVDRCEYALDHPETFPLIARVLAEEILQGLAAMFPTHPDYQASWPPATT